MSLQGLFVVLKGGPNSGNRGHAGIPGHRGGSASSKISSSLILPTSPKNNDKQIENQSLSLNELPKKYPNLFNQLGNSLVIESDILSSNIQNHLNELEKIPPSILKEAKDYGLKVYIGDKGFSDLDDMKRYENVNPRGWGSKITWKDLGGGYDKEGKKLILGKDKFGSKGTATHEFGHALDAMRGDISHKDADFNKVYNGMLKNKTLSRYERQGKGAGKQEAFAECFSRYITDKEKLKSDRGEKVVSFFDKEITNPANRKLIIEKKPTTKKLTFDKPSEYKTPPSLVGILTNRPTKGGYGGVY